MNASGDIHIRMKDSSGNADRVLLRQASTNDVYIGDIDANNGKVVIRTNGNDAVTITSGGNLLIGANQLIGINTSDGSDFGYLAIAGAGGDGANRGGHIYLSGNERGVDAGNVAIAAGNIPSGLGDPGAIVFRTGGSGQMKIAPSGNVLIGLTTDGGYKLHVNGASYLNGYNYASSIQYFRPVSDTVNPAGGEGVLIFSGGQAAIRMNSSYTMNFDVYNGGTQHTPLQIRQTGNTVRVNSENNSLCLALAFGGVEHGYLGATSGNGRSLLAYSQNGGYVYLSSSSTWVAASDVNRKKNFESYNKGLAEICSLQPTLFNLKTQSDDEPKIAGLIAQQVGEHIQEAFSDGEFIGIDYNVLTVTIINAIKELKAELDELKSKN